MLQSQRTASEIKTSFSFAVYIFVNMEKWKFNHSFAPLHHPYN